MRTRLATQLFLLIVLFYSNYFFYFNSWKSSSSEDLIRVTTHRYGEEFCVAYNVTVANRSFEEEGMKPVTLALHGTPIYLNFIFRQVSEWDGPISVSLFVDRPSQIAVEFLYNIYLCDKAFAEKVSLHVVFRLPPFSTKCPFVDVNIINCSIITYKYMNTFMNSLIPPFGIYPINVMRNVARRGASSTFQLVSDIEMIFSENFAQEATKLANEYLCDACENLIVIRRFELDKKAKKVPRKITELKKHIDNKTAFEFHHKVFPAGHTIEGLWHWFRVSTNSSVPFLWEIPYKGPSWEPQLIMHSSAPYVEENIPTRWRDQQAFVYELCRANYTFLLASHLFNVHKGVKTEASPLETAVKNHQRKLRERYLNRYLKRINELYSNSSKRCGKFTL